MPDSADIIKALGLEEHAEGGFFREIFRSPVLTQATKQRSAGTSILYLMTATDISRWHQVKTDEIWMYHAGSPALQLLLFPDGTWTERIIGPDIMSGHIPQSLVPSHTWQAAVLLDGKSDPDAWGLFGAVVVPGFDYADFKVGSAVELVKKYPDAEESIRDAGLFI